MTVLADLTDQTRLIQALVEKSLIQTEEIKSGGDMGDGANDALRNMVDFHLVTLELKRLASDLHRIAEDLLADGLGDQRRVAVGEHTVEVRRAYKRTDWEHSKLAMHVALSATQGELIEGMADIVDAFVKCCNPGWRVTALKERGLDDSEYCVRELSRATVTVV